LADGLSKKIIGSDNILTKVVGYQQPNCLSLVLFTETSWNSWLEPFRFHVNCFHFRATVFVHVGPAQLCTGNGASFHKCSQSRWKGTP